MHTYDTLEELVALLDKHFENTERFRFNYYLKDHKFHYNILIDGKTKREGDMLIEDTFINTYDLPKDCQDWFDDQWFEFRRNDIQLPSETGKDITLSEHVIVTDPCYNIDTWCNGELTDVKPGVYHTKATFTDIDGWGRRCSSLILWHESVDEPTNYEHTDIVVGVDSGQAGVVDFPYFETLDKDNNRKEQWYDNIQTFTYVRQPAPKHVLSTINEAKDLYNESFKILDRIVKAKQEGNLKLADIIEIDYNTKRSRISKLLRDNFLDEQSFIDHTLAPMSVDQLWTDEHSAITCSGLGDGSYDCFIAKDGDQIVGIKIDYFYDEDED